jgi:PGAP1-like protein
MTTLVFIHGRGQASPPDVARDPQRLAAYVDGKRREWLGGLSRGLLAAGVPPVTDAVYPFYANDFQQRIQAYEAGGGRRPDLELGAIPDDQRDGQEAALLETTSAALDDLLRGLDFDPVRELSYTEPELAREAASRAVQGPEELGWDDFLKIPILRSGLAFLARKTGVPAVVIEEFLTDVAYYLQLQDMRNAVLQIVESSVQEALPTGGSVVVVGHSLGSIVAYDLLTRLDQNIQVELFVTAGSPLGYPVVEKNLLGKQPGQKPRIPSVVPARAAAWVNAFDVRDIVALLHPLAADYAAAVDRQLDDQQTFNASYPHSIADYLSDPDVAAPIGRALKA